MRFWIRELGGWLLVLLGLALFFLCFVLALARQYSASGTMTVISIIVFRGGIHLLKVALAARVCMRAQEALAANRPPAAAARRAAFAAAVGLRA